MTDNQDNTPSNTPDSDKENVVTEKENIPRDDYSETTDLRDELMAYGKAEPLYIDYVGEMPVPTGSRRYYTFLGFAVHGNKTFLRVFSCIVGTHKGRKAIWAIRQLINLDHVNAIGPLSISEPEHIKYLD